MTQLFRLANEGLLNRNKEIEFYFNGKNIQVTREIH